MCVGAPATMWKKVSRRVPDFPVARQEFSLARASARRQEKENRERQRVGKGEREIRETNRITLTLFLPAELSFLSLARA